MVALNVDYREPKRCARGTSDGDVSRFTAPRAPVLQLGPATYRLIYGASKRSSDEQSGKEKVIDSAPEIDRAGKARPRQRLLSLPGKRAASSTSGVHVVRARD